MDYEKVFQENHIKKTQGRMCILEVLMENKDALDVESIMMKCIDKGMGIDLSTVYRTLELFCKVKIIEKYDFGHGKYNYSLKKSGHKHVLECNLCHKEIEIDCPMQQIKEAIRNQTGFTLIEPELDTKINGVCRECSKKNRR
jgi:Fur family transcriptional regulator, ferric uptake regulator